VWEFDFSIEPLMGFGVKIVRIEYSTDDTTWTALSNLPEFARAPGQPSYTHQESDFGGLFKCLLDGSRNIW
jgi:hypothetical protein